MNFVLKKNLRRQTGLLETKQNNNKTKNETLCGH